MELYYSLLYMFLPGMSWLAIAIVVGLVLLIIFVPLLRRIALSVVMVVPAAIVAAVGACSFVLWGPAGILGRWLVSDKKMTAEMERFLSSPGTPELTPLTAGRREEVARGLWREEDFPYLYQPVPADIVRPLHEDGKLIGGLPITWLADRYMTSGALGSALVLGRKVGCSLFIVLAGLWIFNAIVPVVLTFANILEERRPVIEQWPSLPETAMPEWMWWSVGVRVLLASAENLPAQILLIVLGVAALALGAAAIAFLVAIRHWLNQKGLPYELKTKDTDVRWPYRAEVRRMLHRTYVQQFRQATGFLKDSPLFKVGEATGFLRARGDMTAPVPNQTMALDGESLFQHVLVFGGTGEGKTTALLKPLMEQIMPRPNFGMYVCDAKGVLWNDAAEIAEKVGRSGDVRVIGTGKSQVGIDPLRNLTPTQVASVLRSVLQQMGGGSESFWSDMAANIIRHALTIGYAYAQTEAGKKEALATKVNPYSLWWAYQFIVGNRIAATVNAIAADGKTLRAVIADASGQRKAELEARYRQIFSGDYRASVEYLGSAWQNMARNTRTGILAHVTQLLDGFSGAETLRQRFATGQREGTIEIADALNGRIVLNAVSTVEDGLPARLVNILLKTALYRAARVREAAWKAESGGRRPQDHPCVVLIDEVQEVVTADPVSGLSDATFWNVARSSGLAGVFATQTVAALVQALGKDSACNFMQQARSKVFFRSEDQETINYAIWCSGQFERNRVFDDGQRESLEFRELLDGWTPTLPVDETEGIEDDPKILFKVARALLVMQRQQIGKTEHRANYVPDLRFADQAATFSPDAEGTASALTQQLAVNTHLQQAEWRAEDLERSYRANGNAFHPALMTSDLAGMGRWHAYAYLQRAGAARQDIVAVTHQFG
jgi:type IV secretory pathway TraG/TraD family ATPase VirD4